MKANAYHFTQTADHPVPIISVEGRTFPVEIRYQPPEEASDLGREKTEIVDFAFKQSRENIHCTSGRRAQVIEFFQSHFMPIDQRRQPFVQAVVEAFVSRQDQQIRRQLFAKPGAGCQPVP